MPLLRKLPRRISHLTEDLHDGRLSVNVRVLAHREDRNFITRLIQQFTIAVLAGFCVLGGVVLIAFGEGGPALTDYLTWQTALGYIVLFAGFMLSLRTVTLVLYTATATPWPGDEGSSPGNGWGREGGIADSAMDEGSTK